MKTSAISFLFFAAALAVPASRAAVPSVSGVTIAQDPLSRAVTVAYTLADAPAIITLDICTNDVSIGPENVWAVEGDVNKLVQEGARTIVWHPDKSWPDRSFGAGVVSARVTAWNENDPPMYLSADLVTGAISYYTCAEAVPGGVQDILYKTTSVLMRRIYARNKAFAMGSPSDEPGRWSSDKRETQHEVAFDHDYYIGVYEVTQQQYMQLASAWPAYHSNAEWRATRPVENISFATIRGNGTYYPDSPLDTSFLGLLRTKTGLAFDLPGCAQWEYAAKAGNGDGKWGDGTPISAALSGAGDKKDFKDATYNSLGRNAYNNAMGSYSSAASTGLSTTSQDVDTTCGTAAVGSFPPNSWGLYDMHGNVYEVCADPYDVNNGYGETPVSGTGNRVRKGGSFQRGPFRHRAAYQLAWDGSKGQDTGVRLAITLE